jgi:hypothetical protein
MKKPSPRNVIVIFALVISSCNNITRNPPSTLTPHLESPTNTPTESKSGCPKAGTPSDMNIPENLDNDTVDEAIYKFILNYLHEGGSPQNLPEALVSKMPAKFGLSLQITPLDMNGDNINELLINITRNPHKDSYSLIFHCSSGYYLEAGGFGGEILLIEDLNGDKNPEIVFRSYWHGSGCLENYDVVGWSKMGGGGQAVNYLKPDYFPLSNYFPCGTELHIQDKDNDGQKELTFTGIEDAWDSAHSGLPGREFSYSYEARDMQTYIKVSEKYTTSPARVHVLADAQKALDESRGLLPSDAIELYEKAINDETLNDFPSTRDKKKKEGLSHAKEYTIAFALFRLVTIYYDIDRSIDEAKIKSIVETLNNKFPVGTPGSEFADITRLYIRELNDGKTQSIACSVVSLYIEQKYPNLENEFSWPGVLYYDNGTICPY